ncbi:MAG TPA: hypothetical protein VFZ78_03165, partial [Flavisolibacter sp.]
NVAHHSAALTLAELFALVARVLAPGGTFFLLLPATRLKDAAEAGIAHSLFIHKVIHVRQSVLHDPFRVMIRGGRMPGDTETTEMAVWDAQQEYTPEFTGLLKEYYLYL